jgi:very-short-patch-repair endonuclease
MKTRTTASERIPKALSKGEEAFVRQCEVEWLTPEREFMFHPTHKWRFDFAFRFAKLAVEVEGGVNGRHQRIGGSTADCVKYSEAAVLGWRVIRATTAQVMSGQAIIWVLKALK